MTKLLLLFLGVKMKAYKIISYVLDFENHGPAEIEVEFQNSNLHINITEISEAEIGEWSDDHPLNSSNAKLDDYKWSRLK